MENLTLEKVIELKEGLENCIKVAQQNMMDIGEQLLEEKAKENFSQEKLESLVKTLNMYVDFLAQQYKNNAKLEARINELQG